MFHERPYMTAQYFHKGISRRAVLVVPSQIFDLSYLFPLLLRYTFLSLTYISSTNNTHFVKLTRIPLTGYITLVYPTEISIQSEKSHPLCTDTLLPKALKRHWESIMEQIAPSVMPTNESRLETIDHNSETQETALMNVCQNRRDDSVEYLLKLNHKDIQVNL
jgi:hypothetical protein